MVRFFLMLAFMVWSSGVCAQTVEPDDLKLELSFEDRSGPLYTGEMVLLKVRGFYKIRIARETLEQPSLDGFDWMQLGEDTWTKDTSQGGEILQFERIVALFPNRAGTLEIDPFVHDLELWTLTGERYGHSLASAPISIEVTERPVQDEWWLPARRLTVTDSWSNAPDQLGTGEGALRVVTITVEGVRPEQIPRMPELESAGAHVFPHPEARITRLYRRGPVTRAVWRWTVRPENPPSAYLKPIRLPYFDTRAREHREIVIAAQRIAMTEEAVAEYLAGADRESVAAVEARAQATDSAARMARYAAGAVAPVGLLTGMIGGVFLLSPGLRRRRRARLLSRIGRIGPAPEIRALKRAAARGDVSGTRAAGLRIIRQGRGDTGRMTDALHALDRAVYGAAPAEPDLSAFAAAIAKAARSASVEPGQGQYFLDG